MAVFLLGGGGLISIVFSSIAGGGVEQSFIYPIYAGIIVLAGLIAVSYTHLRWAFSSLFSFLRYARPLHKVRLFPSTNSM